MNLGIDILPLQANRVLLVLELEILNHSELHQVQACL